MSETQARSTEHLGVLKKWLKRFCAFQIELEFGSVGFGEEGKTGVRGENLLGASERTNNKLKQDMEQETGA